MKEKIAKTNVARLLDKAKIAYELIPYEVDENDLSAVHEMCIRDRGDFITASHYFTTYYNTYPRGVYTEQARYCLLYTSAFPNGNFIEASHLGGRAHVIELIRIFEKERPGVPMRVDHGRMMLDLSLIHICIIIVGFIFATQI